MAEKEIYDPSYRELVACLKDTRKKRGLTQAQVASKMGLCRTWVAKIECCEIGLDVVGLVKLCGVYKLRATDVIGVIGKAL